MVRVCLDANVPFGIVFASKAALSTVGTTARIHKVATRYDDGRLDIIVVGEDRFRVKEVFRDLPYLSTEITPVVDEQVSTADDHAVRSRVIARHMKLLEFAGEAVRTEIYEEPETLSFVVGRTAGLDIESKQAVLEMHSESKRLRYLSAHLEQLIRRVRKAKSINDLARGDGHASGIPGLEPPAPPSDT